MTKISLLLSIIILNACQAQDIKVQGTKYNEKHYQTQLCQQLNGTMEYKLPDSTRVDCLTQQYAIEVDWGKKWAEGIGQALYYADITQKQPAVALIISEKETRYLKRLKKVAQSHGITIFILTR